MEIGQMRVPWFTQLCQYQTCLERVGNTNGKRGKVEYLSYFSAHILCTDLAKLIAHSDNSPARLKNGPAKFKWITVSLIGLTLF